MKVFLKDCLDINVCDSYDRIPLHYALKHNNVDVVSLLINNGAVDEDKGTIMHFAAQNKSVDVVKMVIDMGADVKALNTLQMTPLHLAAQH